MKKIFITGATDGIGKLTALSLVRAGHHLLVHGRSQTKLDRVLDELRGAADTTAVEGYRADLSELDEVQALASTVRAKHERLDVLINNAGVLKTPQTITKAGLDVRFVVNTLAPYLLTRKLLPLLRPGGRIVNLSSAAQAPVDLKALRGEVPLDDMGAYAQSKLAITMWTTALAEQLKPDILAVSVNPGSLLATKMVQEGFGVAGKDLQIGADILCKAALSAEFADAHGLYFDNDAKRFGAIHPDAANPAKRAQLTETLDDLLGKFVSRKDAR